MSEYGSRLKQLNAELASLNKDIEEAEDQIDYYNNEIASMQWKIGEIKEEVEQVEMLVDDEDEVAL